MRKLLIVLASLLLPFNSGCSKLSLPGHGDNKVTEAEQSLMLPDPLPQTNARCPFCGHGMMIKRGYINERVLCGRCLNQISARQARAMFGSSR